MTIYKVYNTRRAAENYIAKFLPNNTEVRIDEAAGMFYVISGRSGYQA